MGARAQLGPGSDIIPEIRSAVRVGQATLSGALLAFQQVSTKSNSLRLRRRRRQTEKFVSQSGFSLEVARYFCATGPRNGARKPERAGPLFAPPACGRPLAEGATAARNSSRRSGARSSRGPVECARHSGPRCVSSRLARYLPMICGTRNGPGATLTRRARINAPDCGPAASGTRATGAVNARPLQRNAPPSNLQHRRRPRRARQHFMGSERAPPASG